MVPKISLTAECHRDHAIRVLARREAEKLETVYKTFNYEDLEVKVEISSVDESEISSQICFQMILYKRLGGSTTSVIEGPDLETTRVFLRLCERPNGPLKRGTSTQPRL